MSILDHLAGALGRRDEVPNVELAKRIAAKKDKAAVKELAENLRHKSKDIRHDCIKVLYETGYADPELIAPYWKEFLALLDDKSNRMQWGAMSALSSIAGERPKEIYAALDRIMAAADSGSVITRDHAMSILLKLAAVKQYASDAFTLYLDQLRTAPVNQLPKYAEDAAALVPAKDARLFVKILSSRLDEIDKDSKRKRVEKVMRKLGGA